MLPSRSGTENPRIRFQGVPWVRSLAANSPLPLAIDNLLMSKKKKASVALSVYVLILVFLTTTVKKLPARRVIFFGALKALCGPMANCKWVFGYLPKSSFCRRRRTRLRGKEYGKPD